MGKVVFKIIAVGFVCFLLVAAIHEAVPKLCTAQGPSRTDTCPFCSLIYTLVIVGGFLVLVRPGGIRFCRTHFAAHPLSIEDSVAILLRGPPAV